ncbi:MAG: hypothetical protein FWJ59_07895, partial [Caldicoprobacter sp.]|uniref:hypothetical protein n=1 Tax=Caldicoprobacter sp. TaxID=2004500 RepID=UPI0039C1D99A
MKKTLIIIACLFLLGCSNSNLQPYENGENEKAIQPNEIHDTVSKETKENSSGTDSTATSKTNDMNTPGNLSEMLMTVEN